ncbi:MULTISPECIES: RNA-binding cell elongation regulator Jag/EloR [Pseudothermotoga]|uniref:RNA-binding protein KhpB n=1 Tax=Pseudothermotoga lettingae (strain ATCC BAA-301 / DSM 14385 / NBRC 107922 / TMO) TaxID=416591 RepID=A8F5C8_PSELT|nr:MULTISPECIES: RNA-binding cell elongation regulator Jag/EloR [Pseudothermotoga]ABV33362.1 single-stranded nucleic acid binding R3H domain protein [Pseudothermotoga lettingae TMO]KUK20208.1 MAG: Single-stranded nucleic acid binding R3H domain protein [Pseudothermotoga lettingae]MDI3494007.1 spoIIIJ-associated protein [Pseudothermotoga sp.]MDK2884468.1 spoIIIJ-associated protein [Pseudothermotoga sp.]GLI49723.1 single-stranded DNA-binding protein [Pseudothermotoga lettingae TMO]
MKKVRISGATIAEALEKAKQEFGLRDEEFDYVVVEKGSKGFFGIMAKEAVVEVSFKKEFYERRLEQFMVGILRSYGKIKVKVSSAGKRFLVLLEGDDLGRLIGKHGKTLAALQHIAMIYLNRLSDTKLSVVVDAGEYREKRKRNLEQIVLQAIDRARVEKKRIVLDPMFAFERRLVHEIVKKYRDVKSYSVGVEPYRKVVIEYSPNGKEVHTT